MSKYQAQDKIKFQFNQEDLDKLQDAAVLRYKNADTFGSVIGANESLYADYPSEFLDLYTEKLEQGYTRHPTLPVEFLQRGGSQFYRCYMVKPNHVQNDEIKVIKNKIEDEYRTELHRCYNEHVETLVAQSVAMAERAEAKKAEQARQKLVEQARKDAIAALGEFAA